MYHVIIISSPQLDKPENTLNELITLLRRFTSSLSNFSLHCIEQRSYILENTKNRILTTLPLPAGKEAHLGFLSEVLCCTFDKCAANSL